MPKQIFTIRDFSGGINSARDPREIDVKEFTYLKNFYVDQIGALRPCGSLVAHNGLVANKSISSMTKNDGTPITMTDRAIIQVLLQSRTLSGNFTIPNFKGFIDNIENLQYMKDAFIKGNEFAAMDRLMRSKGYEDVSDNAKHFIDAIHSAAKSMDIKPDVYFSHLKKQWNEIMEPFMMGKEGGFIKVDGKAVMDIGHLTEIVELIHSMEATKFRASHSELMESVRVALDEISGLSKDNQGKTRKFLGQLMTMIQDKPGDAHRALQILIKTGVYDSKQGFFAWSKFWGREGTIKPYEMLKQLEQQIYYQFSKAENQSAYERLHQLYSDEAKQITDLTKSVSSSLDGFIKKWNIDIINQPGDTASKTLRLKNYTVDEFVSTMLTQSTFKVKETSQKGVKGFRKLGEQQQLDFIMEAINVHATMVHGKEISKIHATKEIGSQYTKEYVKQGKLTEFLDDLGLEMVLVDTKFRIKGRQSRNIMQSRDDSLIREWYNNIARAAPVGKKGLGDTVQTLEDFVKGSEYYGQDGSTGNYVAFLGTFSNGIAIPIKQADMVGLKFINLWDTKVDEWHAAGLLKQERYQKIQSRINKWINERFIIDRDEKTNKILDVKYNHLFSTDARKSGHDMSTMITTLFGHKTMGNEFWSSVVTDWKNPEGFANNVMRRIKLITNPSHTTLSDKYVNEVLQYLDSNFAKNTPALKNIRENIVPIMKGMKKNGMLFHIIRDEGQAGDPIPGVTSVLEQYNLQLRNERSLNDNVTIGDSSKKDGKWVFGEEELGDASLVNSVNIVSKDTMEALKAFLGFANQERVLHGKPIGAKTSDSNMVMLDKTAFIVDADWDVYLKENGLNGVMFTSSTKMLGAGYQDRIINFGD